MRIGYSGVRPFGLGRSILAPLRFTVVRIPFGGERTHPDTAGRTAFQLREFDKGIGRGAAARSYLFSAIGTDVDILVGRGMFDDFPTELQRCFGRRSFVGFGHRHGQRYQFGINLRVGLHLLHLHVIEEPTVGRRLGYRFEDDLRGSRRTSHDELLTLPGILVGKPRFPDRLDGRRGRHLEDFLRRDIVVDRTVADQTHLHGRRRIPRAAGTETSAAVERHLDRRRAILLDRKRRRNDSAAAPCDIGCTPHFEITDTQVDTLFEFVVVSGPSRCDQRIVGSLTVRRGGYAVPVGLGRIRRPARNVIGAFVIFGHPRKVVLEIDVPELAAIVATDGVNHLLTLALVPFLHMQIVDPVAFGRDDAQIHHVGFRNIEFRDGFRPCRRRLALVAQIDELLAVVADLQFQRLLLNGPCRIPDTEAADEIAVALLVDRASDECGRQLLRLAELHGIAARRTLIGGFDGRNGDATLRSARKRRRHADACPVHRVVLGDGDRLGDLPVAETGHGIADQLRSRCLHDLDLGRHAVVRVEMQHDATRIALIGIDRDRHRLAAVSGTRRERQPVDRLVDLDDPVDIGLDLETHLAALVSQAALIGAERRPVEREICRLVDLRFGTSGRCEQRSAQKQDSM